MSLISDKTSSLLSIMQNMSFFQSVGQGVDGPSVRNWVEAIELARSENWYQLCDTVRFLITKTVTDGANWNLNNKLFRSTISEVSARVHLDLTKAEIDPLLATRICDELRSQLLMVCAESETSHLHEIRLFHFVWERLIQGHFPCGWEGNYPSGSLVVF